MLEPDFTDGYDGDCSPSLCRVVTLRSYSCSGEHIMKSRGLVSSGCWRFLAIATSPVLGESPVNHRVPRASRRSSTART